MGSICFKIVANSCLAILSAYAFLTICGCNSDGVFGAGQEVSPLKLVDVYALAIDKASGLTIDPAGAALWVVASQDKSIYKLDLQGAVIERLAYRGEDPEGIAYDPTDSTLWVVEERSRELIHLDLAGNRLAAKGLELSGKKNSGLEGVCLDRAGGLYALNEKSPGLFLALNTQLGIQTRIALTFARDFAGMACGGESGDFWLVSDQDKRLFVWNRTSGVKASYPLPLPQPEGVAVDDRSGRIYIVSDSKARLYVFEVVP